MMPGQSGDDLFSRLNKLAGVGESALKPDQSAAYIQRHYREYVNLWRATEGTGFQIGEKPTAYHNA